MFSFFAKRFRRTAKQLLGNTGERICEKFLKNNGYKTVVRNFRCKTGEIDLVMFSPQGQVVFVEVKTRSGQQFADAEAAITKIKQIRMQRAAKYFIKKHRLEQYPLRFDAVIIIMQPKEKPEIRHYQNIC